MATFLLRVELPDRPGALGAVASRIGALRADVVAVDIVGRNEGRAVDEFVVELADERHVSLLLAEVAEVDGVSVEELRVLPAEFTDRRFDGYQTALALLGEQTEAGVTRVAAERARHELRAVWAAVVDVGQRSVTAAAGEPPAAAWLAAYVSGSRWHGPPRRRPDAPAAHAPAPDVAWAELAGPDEVVMVGRPGWAFSAGDRRQLAAVAELAVARAADLSRGRSARSHPSAAG